MITIASSFALAGRHNCINSLCRIQPFCLQKKKRSRNEPIDHSFIAVLSKTLSQRLQQKMFCRGAVSGPLKLTHYTANNKKAEGYFQLPKIKVVDFLLIMEEIASYLSRYTLSPSKQLHFKGTFIIQNSHRRLLQFYCSIFMGFSTHASRLQNKENDCIIHQMRGTLKIDQGLPDILLFQCRLSMIKIVS